MSDLNNLVERLALDAADYVGDLPVAAAEAINALRAEVEALKVEIERRRAENAQLFVEVEALREERDEFAALVTQYAAEKAPDALAVLARDRDKYAAEVEALRADAERYRWLRESDGLTIRAAAARTPEAFDAAIDAARSAK